MLHRWYGLHGHATETQRHGRRRSRRELHATALDIRLIHPLTTAQKSIPPPPPPSKFYSPDDSVMLEDESGRIRLVGDRLKEARLVTGVIMSALGMETPGGDFEVIDYCFAEMAPQSGLEDQEESAEDTMDVDGAYFDIYVFCTEILTGVR